MQIPILDIYDSYSSGRFQITWHEFHSRRLQDAEWKSPQGAITIILNLFGSIRLNHDQGKEILLTEKSVALNTSSTLKCRFDQMQNHRVMMIHLHSTFLGAMVKDDPSSLLKELRNYFEGGKTRPILMELPPPPLPLHTFVEDLRNPSVPDSLKPTWYPCKITELSIQTLFVQQSVPELFCVSLHRQTQDRVERVKTYLRAHLEESLSLKELGKIAQCSPYYLSRLFSKSEGMTLPQYVRKLRVEKAAEYLRSGRYNVTEAATEVGYSSLSHFTKAFHLEMGCCPGLYHLQTARSDR